MIILIVDKNVVVLTSFIQICCNLFKVYICLFKEEVLLQNYLKKLFSNRNINEVVAHQKLVILYFFMNLYMII